jgi:hypothetical protein
MDQVEVEVEVVILKRLNQMTQADKERLNQQIPQILPAEVLSLLDLLRQADRAQADQAQLLDLLEAQLNLLQERHNLRAVQLKEEVRRLSSL